MAGEIVHIEYPCKDVARGQAFWGGLFGWQFGESAMPGMEYRMAQTGEGSGVAVLEAQPGNPVYYYDTPDIEASMARVNELGGRAGDKTPVPTHGWLSHCTDSEGNAFSLWQADSGAA